MTSRYGPAMGGQLDGKQLRDVLGRLGARRPVFHSEADFQHALAWQIQTEFPSAAVRLETRPFVNRRVYLDLAINLLGHRVAIELKHLTRGLSVEYDGEAFNLANQSAHDISRYDVVKDIKRVEDLLAADLADSGYVVVLSNDGAYWRTGRNADTADAAFRFDEGRELSGTLEWGSSAGPGTSKGREAAVTLAGQYTARWVDYSTVDGRAGRFRYLFVAVEPGDSRPETVLRQHPAAVASSSGGDSRGAGGAASCRQQILRAMAALERRHGRRDFALAEIVAEVRTYGTALAESTIRTHISSVMCVDAPANHGTRYPDLRRAGHGRYERVR